MDHHLLIQFFTTLTIAALGLSKCSSKTNFVPLPPAKLDCLGIECNSTSPYPENCINKLIRKTKLGNVEKMVYEPRDPVKVGLRSPFDDDSEDLAENICATKEITVFPRTAQDDNFQMRFIVNTKEHKQGITFQFCTSTKSFIDGMLLNYHFFCRQTYSTVRLLYLTEDGKLEYGKFSMPSACVCSYKLLRTG